MKRPLEVLTTVVFAALVPLTARSDVGLERVSTQPLLFLTIPVDPRSMAMAQTGAADLTPRAQLYNPASVAFAEGLSYSQASLDWLANYRLMDLGLHGGHVMATDGAQVRLGGAIGYKQLTIEAPAQTIFLPGGSGRTFDAKDWHLSFVGAGALETEHLAVAVGTAFKPTQSRIVDETISAWAFDLGALAEWRLVRDSGACLALTGGASAVNLGPTVDYGSYQAHLPRQVRAGGGIRLDGAPVRFLGRRAPAARIVVLMERIDHSFGRDDLLAAGLEAGVFDTVYFRMGSLHNLDSDVANTNTWGLGLAWSYRHLRLSVDYSTYEDNAYGLSNGFGDIESWGGGISYSF